jgi:hypothetical protein
VAAYGGVLSFTSCRFVSNTAGAGGVHQLGGPYCPGTPGAGGSGGAIVISGTTVSLVNCVLAGNHAGNGGGWYDCACSCYRNGAAAGTGGAIAATAGSLTLVACTLADNAPGTPGVGGAAGVGGVWSNSAQCSVTGSIVWGNSNGQVVAPSPVVANSCVQGGMTGVGNIAVDPVFVNASGADYRLAVSSPCINMGNNAAIPATVGADIAGNLRFVSGCGVQANAAIPAVDMGAYEYQGGGTDCNGDGVCDLRQVSGSQVLQAPTPLNTDRYGWSVAVSGERALVGARSTTTSSGVGAGAAYAYTRHGAAWEDRQTLLAPDGAPDDDFGNAVALNDRWAAIAARFADVNGFADAGAVYVYKLGVGGWEQVVKITASDGHSGDQFGHGLALDGDRLVIGALKGDVSGAVNCGAVYVYQFNGAAWVLETRLMPLDPTPNKGFGISVGISAGVLAVGAPYDASEGIDAGAVYVFRRFAAGWSQSAKLVLNDGTDHAYSNFGEFIALNRDRLLINVPRVTYVGKAQAGAAYVFRNVGTAWTREARLTSNDPQAGEWFGFGLAIDGDRALIGGFRRTESGQAGAGAAYAYQRFGTTWLMAARIDAPDPQSSGYFGYGVGLSGTRALITEFEGGFGTSTATGTVRSFDLAVLDGNHDGTPDSCQIASGQLRDDDHNGIPDSVQFNPCRADFNNIGGVTIDDLNDFLSAWFAGDPSADVDEVAGLAVRDVIVFIAMWFSGC